MAYRYGDRHQQMLFPQSIDDYVPANAPVRAYNAIIDAMDMTEMGFEMDSHKVGCPQYNPQAMLKLLVYGYSYGIRSSRKLERECYYNLSFIWLMGGLKPDHKTIAEFRRRNKAALKQVLHQCARLCLDLGLIEGNVLFVDGTRMRANASIENSWTPQRAQKALDQVETRIEQLLEQCEDLDQQEQDHPSLVHLQDELCDQEYLKDKVRSLLDRVQKESRPSLNTTDADSVRVQTRQGVQSGYSGELVVDDQHGLIVHSDVVSANNDLGQLSGAVRDAQQVLGQPCQVVCADAGFADYEDLAEVERQGIEAVVPSQKQVQKSPPGPFDKSRFSYDESADEYICPCGKRLACIQEDRCRPRKVYRSKQTDCQACMHFGVCTRSSQGRKIERYLNEPFRQMLAQRYASEIGQAIFRRRKCKAELPFGHIKRNLKTDHFWLRGLSGVRAEMALLASCFNITRMINIFGTTRLLAELGG